MEKSKVCILGSGITGLSYAYYLQKYRPDIEFVILEEKENAGGVIQSNKFGDCVVEWGPRGVRPKGKGQNVLEMVEDLGLWDELVFADDKAKKRYLYHDDKLQVLPHSLGSFLSSPYLRIFLKAFYKDLKAKGVRGDESIASFTDRHFGVSFRKLFFDSVVSGIWAGDVEKMSISATLPMLKELERKKGSVIRGMFGRKAQSLDVKQFPKEFTSKALFSFKNGVQTLVEKLKEQLDGCIVYGVKPTEIDFQSKLLRVSDGQVYSYSSLVSTLPAYTLSEFVGGDMAKDLNAINYSPVGILNYKYEKSQLDFDGFGFLVPSKEKSVVLGMVANSNTFPCHGSETHHVNTVMLGGARYDLSYLRSLDLKSEAKEFLSKVFGKQISIDQEEYRFIEKAIPQYEVGHLDRVKRIASNSPQDLIVLGNFMYGVSLIDIISKSKEMVKKLV